ncbi:MAG: hypothetical protein ABW184_13105 [Sphingobium sp.]
MTSSTTTISVYAALLVAVLLTPYVSAWLTPRQDHARLLERLACASLLAGAIILTVARDAQLPMLGAFLLIPLAGLGMRPLLGGVTAALLFATATWWTPALDLGPIPTIIFVVLALAAGCLPRWQTLSRPGMRDPRLLLPMLLCMVVGLVVGLLTAPLETRETIYTTWHHWGAYLAPVEAWRGGGVPYRDFPIQYGLGPTTLLMATCGDDCWSGMYATVITANALYFATLCGSVIILTARSARGLRWLGLVAMFCATFIWTGFPVQFAGPVMTPSVAGLRFLSISALLFHILLAEQRKTPRDWVGHLIWLCSLFWSFEAGMFATLIWWPYLALRDAGSAEGGRGAGIALIIGVVRGVCALAMGVAALVLMLWLLSEKSITVADFFAYFQHPPGVLPVNPVGTVWIALGSIVLALFLLARRGLSPQARPLFICLLGFLVAGAYYISRSHDNNILNLFPLLVLLLLAMGRENGEDAAPGFAGAFARVMLAAMVAFVATFNFGPWREGIKRAGLLTLGPARLVAQLTPGHDNNPPVLPPDGLAGMDYLRARNAGAVMLFDYCKVMPRASGGTAWTGVNNIANFAPLPRSMILHYIRRGAAAYRRSGWILADAEHRHWVEDFKTAYDVREQHVFGTYVAYHMVPRRQR